MRDLLNLMKMLSTTAALVFCAFVAVAIFGVVAFAFSLCFALTAAVLFAAASVTPNVVALLVVCATMGTLAATLLTTTTLKAFGKFSGLEKEEAAV